MDMGLCTLARGTPPPTPSPSPTMTPCNGRSWVKMTDITNITWESATQSAGGLYDVDFYGFGTFPYGRKGTISGVGSATFSDGTDLPASIEMFYSIYVEEAATWDPFEATVSYDGTSLTIYGPGLTTSGEGNTYYYFDSTGASFMDMGLCTLARGTPPPTPAGKRFAITPPTVPTAPPVVPAPTAVPIEELMLADPGDYDGDGTVDPAVFRPASGLWSIRDYTRLYFGRPNTGDLPASGDYDGDGTADIAIFRPDFGLWSVKDLTSCYFGEAGDIPAPGDYDGDVTAEIAVFRPGSGLWAVRGLTPA